MDSIAQSTILFDLPRRCLRCGQEYPLSAFTRNGRYRDGIERYCRRCKAAYHTRRTYRLSPAQYAALLERQAGRCPICGADVTAAAGRRVHVDHDHATGRVRGVLCATCNHLLGHAKDDPAVLRAALAYLDRAKREFD